MFVFMLKKRTKAPFPEIGPRQYPGIFIEIPGMFLAFPYNQSRLPVRFLDIHRACPGLHRQRFAS